MNYFVQTGLRTDSGSAVYNLERRLNDIFSKDYKISAKKVYEKISSGKFARKKPKDDTLIIEKISERIESEEPLRFLFPWGPGKNFYLRKIGYNGDKWNEPDSAEVMGLAVINEMLSELKYPYTATFYTSGGRYNRVNRIAVGEEPEAEWEKNYHEKFKEMTENLIPKAIVHKLEDLYPSRFDIESEVNRPEIKAKVEQFPSKHPERYATMFNNANGHSRSPEVSIRRFIAETVAEEEAGIFKDYDIKIVHASHHHAALQYYSTPDRDDVQPWQGFGAFAPWKESEGKKGIVISKKRYARFGLPETIEMIDVKEIKVSIGVYLEK